MNSPIKRPPAPLVCPRNYSVTKLLIDFTLARILLALTALASPVKSYFGWQLVLGKSLWALVRDLERLAVRLIGWLIAPPRHPWLRAAGSGVLGLRRWHLLAGAHDMLAGWRGRNCGRAGAGVSERVSGRTVGRP